MATFTGTTNNDVAKATTGTLSGFTGGTVDELQDNAGDLFFGNAGNDWIVAGGGADLVSGGAGFDHLEGGAGDDVLNGGSDDDFLKGGLGKDVLDGGDGVDIADYSDKTTSSIAVTLNGSTNATVTVGGVAEDTVRNIENVVGGSGADVLTGDGLANALGGGAGDDFLKGGQGKDALDGGAGVDLADYSDKTSSVAVTLNGSTNATVTIGGVPEDTIRNVETVLGGSAGDTLTGDGLANALGGGGGNDILKGGLGQDQLIGGAGVDRADYSDKTSSVVVTLNGSTNATVAVGGVTEDTIRDIEDVQGGSGADTLTGDGLANALGGGAGDDILKGGLDKDSLDGGAGVDFAIYSDKSSSIVVTLNEATDATVTVGGVAEDTIRSIENVLGGSGADILTGDNLANSLGGGAGNDILKGGLGMDTLDGGAGADLAIYSDKTSSVVVTLNGSTNATVTVGGVAEDTIRNIETVLGGSGADTLTGDGLANGLAGGAGNDILKGGLGKDTLDGGDGADFADFTDKTTSVAVTLNGSTNATVTVGGVAEDTIRNIEKVLGGSGADTLTGDGLANALAGGGRNDILKGGLGKDTLDGGAGVDLADYADKTSSVVVTLNASTNAVVTVGGVAEDTIRNVENVRGGSGADVLAGDGLANAFAGGAGADRFVFKPAFGKDTIVDFSSSDKLAIDHTIFADWASVLNAAQQVGSDTIITASATDTITLRNFAVGSLGQSQVEFV